MFGATLWDLSVVSPEGWFLSLISHGLFKVCQAYPAKVGSGHRRAKATSFQTSSSKETCLRVLVLEASCIKVFALARISEGFSYRVWPPDELIPSERVTAPQFQ